MFVARRHNLDTHTRRFARPFPDYSCFAFYVHRLISISISMISDFTWRPVLLGGRFIHFSSSLPVWLVRVCLCVFLGFVFYAVPVCVRTWRSVHPTVFFIQKKAFVRVSVYVFACVCMRFCMFVSAFLMRSYVHSCAFALSCMCGLLTASCSSCMLCLCGSCLAGGSSDRTASFFSPLCVWVCFMST